MSRSPSAPPLAQPRLLRTLFPLLALAGIAGVGWIGWRFAHTAQHAEVIEPDATRRQAGAGFGELPAPVLPTAAKEPSETRVVVAEPIATAATADRLSELRLRVLEAKTGKPLTDCTARLLTVAARPGKQDLVVTGGAWTVGPHPEGPPPPHIPELDVAARGASPFACPFSVGAVLWVTAAGHGWASVHLTSAVPAEITFLLTATAGLEFTVSAELEYGRAHVDVAVSRGDDPRDALFVRRKVVGGIARFEGLPAGDFEAQLTATVTDHPELDQIALATGTLYVGRTIAMRLDAAPINARLEVRLSVPIDSDDFQRVEEVECKQSELFPAGTASRPMRSGQFSQAIEDGRRVYRLRTPLLIAPGPFEILVRPHGIRASGVATQAAVTIVNLDLPELALRNITIWDVTNDAPFQGRLKVAFDGEAPQVRSAVFGPASRNSRSGNGCISMLLPARPFRFEVIPPMDWVQPADRNWASGEMVPKNLRIELQVPQ